MSWNESVNDTSLRRVWTINFWRRWDLSGGGRGLRRGNRIQRGK
ncbi:hypothetical protein CPAR01_14345 [Colletotrichum paranaense]|uniref:Uncharacterized protein n=3 Tax=Colletotrichum acutatum species complex TaxID=2707335 RepID=A0A9Q8T368_9PEZI|nr:uncharacterized protein CLUP02_12890 [Colletotrichum lupini]XP_060342657.1 uncharacterized protein CPAR01_14345 [Colletotrichum paranaense]KAK1461540.1 hypothetical protein CMEL01_14494 [Colletotrichum melonis]KAK1522802.1 hypothetical protein CPAR01_14345 [Colletotrichum paranaense]UQC87386.1 hypothetical protein CLUP02_12890 [Colletotrichum lupini]